MPEATLEMALDQLKQVGAEFVALRGLNTENKEANSRLAEAIVGCEKQIQEERKSIIAATEAAELANKRADELEARLFAMAQAGKPAEDPLAEARACLREFMVKGITPRVAEQQRDIMENAPAEFRALSVGTDTAGGFLIHPQFEQEIIKPAIDVSDFRPHVRVTPLSSPEWVAPKRTAGVTAYWLGEGGTPTESSATYGEERITAHQLTVQTKTSLRMFAFGPNIESEIAQEAGIALGLKEGAAIVSGTGNLQPEGIIVNATNLANKVTGADAGNDLVDARDFYKLQVGTGAAGSGVQERYRRNGKYALNSATLQAVLNLQDGTGNFLWNINVGFAGGIPTMLAGKPYFVAEDMESEGNGKYPLAFADWNEAYRLTELPGVYALRNPYGSDLGPVFTWVRFIGGQTINPAAIRILSI